jgi:hypothetical protein
MGELARQESDLRAGIPFGMSLDQVRRRARLKEDSVLRIDEPGNAVILQNPQATMTAQAGDTVLVSRFQTEAFQFPCGYDMQIVLLFGHDRNLKQRYIHRFRMCP